MESAVVNYLTNFVQSELDVFSSLLQLLLDVDCLYIIVHLPVPWRVGCAPRAGLGPLHDSRCNSCDLVFDEHLLAESCFVGRLHFSYSAGELVYFFVFSLVVTHAPHQVVFELSLRAKEVRVVPVLYPVLRSLRPPVAATID